MGHVLARTVRPGTAVSVDVIVLVDTALGDTAASVRSAASMLADGFGADQIAVADAAAVSSAVGSYHCPIVVAAVTRHNLKAMLGMPHPLLAIGPRCELCGTGEGVVVGLDGSRRAEAVLPLAAETAAALSGDWELFHVAKPSGRAGTDRGMSDLLEANYLGGVAARMAKSGMAGSWDVLHGDSPAAALIDLARSRHRALIALNTHGETAATNAPIGRTAARALWESPVPVLLSRRRAVPMPPPRPRPERPAPRAAARTRPVAITPPARSSTRSAALVVTALLALLACAVPLPYQVRDGSTRPTVDFLMVDGADQHAGEILVTTVENRPVTALGLLRAWWDPSSDVHPIDARTRSRSGWDAQVERQLMAHAAWNATVVALTHLGLDPAVHDVSFDAHGLTGPSAGLALALGLIDLLEPGDLTGGHRVAVTGALDENGTVVAVGGVAYKAAAARSAGAMVFIVPVDNYQEAAGAEPNLRVIGVSSLDEAITALRNL